MSGATVVQDVVLAAHRARKPLLYVLLDPDKWDEKSAAEMVIEADKAEVDGYLVGGSLSPSPDLSLTVTAVKSATERPVVIFPGGVHHVNGAADAILFLSVLSGRNPESLIGQHVVAAPIVRKLKLEAISTAYLLVESGAVTATEFMSGTRPLPRHKPEIAVAHAMAAEILGFRFAYLEAGSGAEMTVPDDLIRAVSENISIPLIVGGGIRTPETAADKVRAGASLIVIGNHFEKPEHRDQLGRFADAVHGALDSI